jgi:hypothetical protein
MGTAEQALASWTATADAGTTGPDLGPVVLATLVPDREAAGPAIRAWLRAGRRCRGGLGLFDGTSGILAGLRLVADRLPDAVPAADRAGASVAAAGVPWRTADVGFADYDVVGGPAGVLLAQLTGAQPVLAGRLAPAAAHLADLARAPAGLRIGAHAWHPLAGWAQGGVVTGLAHGVAGPLAALGMALPHLPDAAGAAEAVHRLASWLAARRVVDGRGMVSWPRRVPERAPGGTAGRQGWCYGTPGVAWALWAAGRALLHSGHPEGGPLCDVAAAAARTLCAGYDPGCHTDHDPLAICHGAAGVLLVADAFARHAGLPAAAALRDELTGHLTDRLAEVALLDASLLSGAPGVLAALLTATGGDRGWLPCLAMY